MSNAKGVGARPPKKPSPSKKTKGCSKPKR